MAIASNNLTNTTGIQLKDAFVIIVKTAWNKHVINILETGCTKILAQNNVRFQVLEVPGAFEIPFAIKKYWEVFGEGENNFFDEDIDEDFFNADKEITESFDTNKIPNAFIALGCVIKGDTPHFDYVCQGVTQGIMQLNITLPVPVIYGVLTVNTQAQADERLGGAHGHKGEEAAAAAIQMIALSQSFNNM